MPPDPEPQEGEVVEATRPEWLPQQFETPEALAKSYDEARREMDRLRSENERQSREFSEALSRIEAAQQTPPQQQYNPNADPLIIAAQNAWDTGDVPTFMAINAQVNQAAISQVLDQRLGQLNEQLGSATAQDREIALRMAGQKVAAEYGDRWAEIVPELNERINRPGVQPTSASIEAYEQMLREQAQIVDYPRIQAQLTQAEQDRLAKLQAQTLDGGTARVPLTANKDKAAWDEIRNANNGDYGSLVGD